MKNFCKNGLIAFALLFGGVLSAQPCAEKKVFVEVACYKNCRPCMIKVEELLDFYVLHFDQMCVAVYNQSPIGIGSYGEVDKPYRGFHDEFNLDYQSSILVDRTFMPENYSDSEGEDSEAVEDLSTAVSQQIAADYVPVNISIAPEYNPDTREVSIECANKRKNY